MAHPAPGNLQEVQQFLTSLLSQRGPNALPYTEDTKLFIRRHLVSLITTYPSLHLRTATFTHNDGRVVNLLQADGTVPMLFQGVTYNIPVIIWLMESYPRNPPFVYVNPSRDMIIKRPHPHVNPSGLVSVPYLHNWIYPSSHLVDLVGELSAVFSKEPPLYSVRIPNPNSNPNPAPSPNAYLGPAVHRPLAQSPYGSLPTPGRSQTEDAADVYKRNAMEKIVDSVVTDVWELRKAREMEMESLLSAQALLRKREDEIGKGLQVMQDEVAGLEGQLQVLLMNSDVLAEWLRNNEKNKASESTELNADAAFECVDVLSKQMLEGIAADLAIEDVVYSLDKAVQEGSVSFDQYLRNVRLLSREQFFHRATVTKVRAVQLQSQVANMAARVQNFADS